MKLPAYEFDPVAFLVSRRFPIKWKGHEIDEAGLELLSPTPELIEQLQKFRKELLEKTPQQIETLVSEERKKIAAEKEAKWWFNAPGTAADYEHWSKAAYWTIDESVALTFGKRPDKVTWEAIRPLVNVSDLARAFELRRDLALRAKGMKQLASSNLPGFFLAWAKRLDIPFPNELARAVVARGNWIGDWKASYDHEVQNHAATVEWAKAEIEKTLRFASESQDKALESGKKAISERDVLIAEMSSQIANVKAQLEEASAQKPDTKKTFDVRERESLLKLIIGMAIGGYGLNPKAARSQITGQIATDLTINGVRLDEDTVRKYLQEAKELLPPSETE